MNAQRISPEIRDIHVPAPLRDLPLWCVWAFEQHDGEAKLRKVPQYSMGGRRYGTQGSPEDRAKLTTFAIARDAAARRGLDGVGIALLPDSGVVALDFDNCVADGKVNPEVLDLVKSTYSEFSPSGKGVRALFTGGADVLGNRKSPTTADQFGAEFFSDKGFCTVTGHMLDHVELLGLEDTVAPLPRSVIDFCERRFGAARTAAPSDDFMIGHEPKLGLSPERMRELVEHLDADISRDEWIKVGMALHHETDGGEDGFELWNDWSSNGYKYPSEEALRGQWDSFSRRKGHKQVTMASVIRMTKDTTISAGDISAKADEIVAQSSSVHGPYTPSDWAGKFPAYSAGRMAQAKPVDWLVKGVLPAADIVSIYGASGAGKSFAALDISAAIARGVPWRGCRTKRGRVLIIAAEGAGGYGNRVRALANKLCIEPNDLDIAIVTAPPNIMQEDDIAELVATVRAVGDVALVVIDTLAQVTPGANENTSEDMGRALANCRVLREACGATILLVHHAGKDLSRGARGWSGLKGAMDAELEVNRDIDSGAREIVVRKQKDGRDGDVYPFVLETVVLGLDGDGDEITSCIVVECEARAKQAEEPKGKRRGVVETHILEVMTLFGERDIVSVEEVVAAAAEAMPEPESGKRDTRRQTIMRALGNMGKEKDGPLKVDGGVVIFYE